MKRLTAFLLIVGLLAPGVLLGAACCQASVSAESAAWTQTDRCCTDGTACGLSAQTCEPAVLREEGVAPVRLSHDSSTRLSHDLLSAWSSWTIRSWWTRRVRLASADPSASFHSIVSLPLRL